MYASLHGPARALNHVIYMRNKVTHHGKWFEPCRGISYLFGVVVRVRVVFRKTVVAESPTAAFLKTSLAPTITPNK